MFFCNPDIISDCFPTLPFSTSHHNSIYFNITNRLYSPQLAYSSLRPQWMKAPWTLIYNIVHSVDWTIAFSSLTIDDCVNYLTNISLSHFALNPTMEVKIAHLKYPVKLRKLYILLQRSVKNPTFSISINRACGKHHLDIHKFECKLEH